MLDITKTNETLFLRKPTTIVITAIYKLIIKKS